MSEARRIVRMAEFRRVIAAVFLGLLLGGILVRLARHRAGVS